MLGAEVGEDCQVCNGAIVLPGAKVGNRSQIQLWAGIARLAQIGEDVFIGPNVVFCNARKPRVGMPHDELQRIVVEDGAVIGANSSIMAGVTIGKGATVGAGSVVLWSVPPGETWAGNPARRIS
jgi:acetyltransferase-like isoleucine patch superfamily enzyme